MENENRIAASRLIRVSPHEVENQLELSLRQAYESLDPKLRPPFSLEIPDPQEYLELNKAIAFGVLCEPDSCKTHIKHLHALVTDGYALFTSLLVGIVVELYVNLVDSAKIQLVWVTKEMVDVSSVGIEDLISLLLRRIGTGDYSDQNVWLCSELVGLFLEKWDCLLDDLPLVLTSVLYCFLRLLADHCRVLGVVKLDYVKRLEIRFCVKMFREQLDLCLKIGRDLVRLLQDLSHVSEFREIWNDLVSNHCSDIYKLRTSSRYFVLRITPEMETKLRFLLGNVKLGSHKRHQIWFLKKFLLGPEKEMLLIDIVRFICCGIHPTNEIIRSEIMPRWAVIGWLLELCRQNQYIERSVKLALFYDWLFFNESIDNIMNVEPAALLMVWSIPQYPHITHSLLEFLLHIVETYDIARRDIIVRGVTSVFREIERKGVIRSLDIFLANPALAPDLKKKLANLFSCHQEKVTVNLHQLSVPSKQTCLSLDSNLKECSTKI
ncbi:integrator complex subunit 3 [Capsella rubella]|nr:integrator complex subunit 3 [Capsella rubella]XP_023633726.1 integrator complex subunit 3 [Capsella rubella]XP_023633727.1 integrator complex subunit 3 [Capsella rubella]XP_023633728.1 integrator complex subunit 3 [Capsella rubella]XP_023633729.1 integrator complex subunit 3 [Capsella rubella]XP_023633730.1 integrator complex subunit 3 [Capsella rubella]